MLANHALPACLHWHNKNTVPSMLKARAASACRSSCLSMWELCGVSAAVAQGRRGQFTEHQPVVGAEMAQMPEPPARCDVLHGVGVRIGYLELAPYPIQAHGADVGDRIDVEHILSSRLPITGSARLSWNRC